MQQQLGRPQDDLEKAEEQLAAAETKKAANMRIDEDLSIRTESEKSGIDELQQGKQLHIETVQKQDELYEDTLSSSDQELNWIREELTLALEKKDAALKEAEDARKSAVANTEKIANLSAELNSVKESLANSNGELDIREKNLESLKVEFEKANHIEVELSKKESSMEKLKKELRNSMEFESCAMNLLSECRIRIQVLEAETERAKESESKTFDSLISQTKQFEQTKILLEEAKFEIISLREKAESLEASLEKNSMKETFEILKSELQVARECLDHAQEGKELASSNARSLASEMSVLRTELNLAIEAEEKSKNAMDDLALVLKEVSTEASEVKEKLGLTQAQLENVRAEAEHSKQMVKSAEERFQGLLEEARKELDREKGKTDRLKLEAEESILAWNEQETGFINCIRQAEEETATAKQENIKLKESLTAAEDLDKGLREENHKLRDILKQAINEANVAKEASSIARTENSQLKDILSEKDNALLMLCQENKQLRIKEVAALENIKELKRFLSARSATNSRAEDKEPGEVVLKKQSSTAEEDPKDGKKSFKKQNSTEDKVFKKQNSTEEELKSGRKLSKVLSINLEDLKIPNVYKEADEDPERAETLKGSIFDVDSPAKSSPEITYSEKATQHKDGKKAVKKQNSTEEEHKDSKKVYKKQNSAEEEHKSGKKLSKVLSINLEDLRIPNVYKEADQNSERAETLKGSIFDVVDSLDKSSPEKNSSEKATHHRKGPSIAVMDDGETMTSEEFEHLDGAQFDYAEGERSSHRKKKALLRRVGDLLMRKGVHNNNNNQNQNQNLKREPSIG